MLMLKLLGGTSIKKFGFRKLVQEVHRKSSRLLIISQYLRSGSSLI